MLNAENPKFEGNDSSLLSDLAHILYNSREWHADLQDRFEIHSAVISAFKIAKCCDFHRLVLEWPHRSIDDPKMLAYVRSEDKAAPEKNTKTSVGKYIKRHFPTMKDDVLRDLVYRHTAVGCRFITTSDEMVNAVQNGPTSCMQKEWNTHPYKVYDPKLGWSMAIRVDEEGAIVARALVYEGKIFVRTYGNGGCDNELSSWLDEQGVEEEGSWPEGAELRLIEYDNSCGFLAPYIDGDNQDVDVDGDVLTICYSGEFECTSQFGDAEGGGEPCMDCGDRVDEEGRYYVNVHESRMVCESCLHGNYTRVNETRRSDGYYVRNDDAVEVDGEWYDVNNLPDFIVTLEDGDYCHEDNAVECVESGDLYHRNDRDLVELESGDMCHMDHAWKCFASDEWYGDSENYVLVDGAKYHPDHAPDEDEGEEVDGVVVPRHNYEKPEGSISNEAQVVLDLAVPHKWQHVIDAFKRGETIQAKWLPHYISNDTWSNMTVSPEDQDSTVLEWRIKHKWQDVIDARDEGKAIELRWHPTENWQDLWSTFDFETDCTSSRLEFRVKAEQTEGETA